MLFACNRDNAESAGQVHLTYLGTGGARSFGTEDASQRQLKVLVRGATRRRGVGGHGDELKQPPDFVSSLL